MRCLRVFTTSGAIARSRASISPISSCASGERESAKRSAGVYTYRAVCDVSVRSMQGVGYVRVELRGEGERVLDELEEVYELAVLWLRLWIGT